VTAAAGARSTRWIHGASADDPTFQVVELDRGTFVLRQSKRVHFEAPFLYLLCGRDAALLVDTGAATGAAAAAAQPARPALSLRQVVDSILAEWGRETGVSSPRLVVAHTHGDSDHIGYDPEFAARPRTTLVAATLEATHDTFDVSLDAPGRVELGSRTIEVVATPGHTSEHVAFYDPRTGIVLTGDSFYPGFLYVSDWNAFRASVKRLLCFTQARDATCLLGAHIEMTRHGVPYEPGTLFQPAEHVLPLDREHLRTLDAALADLVQPTRLVLPFCVVEPVEPRAS
jgi:hydroxyacylglutathione hydrolase